MVCPNCNAELPKGHLYCEKCGTEIQMVPIFEPEVEESINETLSGVADVIVEESDLSQQSGRRKAKLHRKRPNSKIILYGLLGLFVICIIAWISVRVNQYCSYDYQYQKAQECFQGQNYEEAADFVKRAIAIDDTQADAQMLLSDLYVQKEQDDEALAVLLPLLESSSNNIEVYRRIVAIYVHKENYTAIQQLMEACKDVQITAQFTQYIAVAPEFSLEEGTYAQKEVLKLMSASEGDIYYTDDGSEPTTASKKYMSAISLGEGTHVITALFVNPNGISSETVTHTYQIELPIPVEPLIAPKSGNYTSPEPITVTREQEDGAVIYYTTDDSEPTEESSIYSTPLPMPLGASHFRFVAISSDGTKSMESEASYHLNIVSLIDTTTAENAVIMTLYGKGQLSDIAGTSKDGKTKYRYICTAAAKAGTRIYYLVEEFDVTERDSVSTGRYFGVDVRTGELYNVTINADTGAFEFSLFSLLFN